MNAIPDATARRNLILGLILGTVVIGFVVLWIVLFTHEGLPKDPAMWKKMQEGRGTGAEVRP